MTNAVVEELDIRPVDLSTVKFTAEQFEQVCEANPDRSFAALNRLSQKTVKLFLEKALSKITSFDRNQQLLSTST
jgi:hypothetical protein